ncbi:MAG TPA: DUF4450 domain-containing protein [Verrucomicrobiae bacterium]
MNPQEQRHPISTHAWWKAVEVECWALNVECFPVARIALLVLLFLSATATAQPAPAPLTAPRYTPDGTDFVITNGAEFFNRPLYGNHNAFRVDAGDKPEFSLYLPGRGGNLRFGIRTSAGAKWLNDADRIIARYRPGAMVYQIDDGLLGQHPLQLTALPLSDAKGLIVRVTIDPAAPQTELIWGFGGANGQRGARGGDIGCEREHVSQFFQLQADACADSEFTLAASRFTLHSKTATINGAASPGATHRLGNAQFWNNLFSLLSTPAETNTPAVVIGQIRMSPDHPLDLALYSVDTATGTPNVAELPLLFVTAEDRRGALARRVTVSTPDPYINAAAGALTVAADALWDDAQQSFMHGAVAWRQRLLGWRGPYAGDELAWHDRTAAHFISFAREQNVTPIPERISPPERSANLSRNETALHSNGDLTKAHYDMNLLAVDAFFRHLLWTGDLKFARTNWPVIERHFAWEKRLFRREFGPDKLPLYESYAAIWASDDLAYNGGGAAHASALNYYANKMAARVAKLLGRDPAPYEQEAALIYRAMQKYLWLPETGNFAEFRDYLGLQLPHPDAALWTFYHTLDSEVPTPAQAAQMCQWVDQNLSHLPVLAAEHGRAGSETPFILPTTHWMPYQWSLNNVVVAESAQAALGYWQAARPATAFALFKGTLLETMYCGLCPGNIGAMTRHDRARGEAQRDFGDGIGAVSRALVEGLFGVKPDALAGELKIVPGYPADWSFASIHHPDFDYEFRRDAFSDSYFITAKFSKPMALRLQILAQLGSVGAVTVNGQTTKVTPLANSPSLGRLEIVTDAAPQWRVVVRSHNGMSQTPAASESQPRPKPRSAETVSTFNWQAPLSGGKFDCIDLATIFNDRVTQIFRNEYRSPRSPFCSLATPKQGIGSWCHPQDRFDVDDSGLRTTAAQAGGKILLPDGIPLATPGSAAAKNVAFVSQWDNYPREISVPLTGKSSHAFLLMAGSTGAMQSRFDNGEILVNYTDGSTTRLALHNPTTWWPIDQDYFIDDAAFPRPGPLPVRVDLKTGRVRTATANAVGKQDATLPVPGGAATVLDLPLDPGKELKALTVHALANEVVIGLMSVTLQR